MGLSVRVIFTAALLSAAGTTGVSVESARLSAVNQGSGLGRKSSEGADILNGIRVGAGGVGKPVGTDGPLEAGTLSGAGPPVPFGESLKGMRVGEFDVFALV